MRWRAAGLAGLVLLAGGLGTGLWLQHQALARQAAAGGYAQAEPAARVAAQFSAEHDSRTLPTTTDVDGSTPAAPMPPAEPVRASVVAPGDACVAARCAGGWPACPDPASGTQCFDDQTCGRCAEGLLQRSPSLADLDTAMCVGRRMLERSTRSGNLRFGGWGQQLVGETWEARGCAPKAVGAYQDSVRQRCRYESQDRRTALDMESFRQNLQDVVDRCNRLQPGACEPCRR